MENIHCNVYSNTGLVLKEIRQYESHLVNWLNTVLDEWVDGSTQLEAIISHLCPQTIQRTKMKGNLFMCIDVFCFSYATILVKAQHIHFGP